MEKSNPELRTPLLSKDYSEKSTLVARTPRYQRELVIKVKGDDNPDLVTWDGPHDPANPKNWSFGDKWRATCMVSAFTFISPISTSMTAPALSRIGQDLNITQGFVQSLTLSTFVLAYAFGPFLVAPLAEIYGRRRVLQYFNLIFLVFNTLCGFSQSASQLIACRFMAGFGGSAALVVGAGVLADVWRPEERGVSISIYTMITLMGPTLGPLLGGFITQYSSWRWAFYSISIGCGIIQFLGLFLLSETFAPLILGKKAAELRLLTLNPNLRTRWEKPDRTFTRIALGALARPFVLLGTQLIVQILAIYIAFLFGLMYLVLATFPKVWTEVYGQSISMSGLHYLALALGYGIGTQGCTRIIDVMYKRLTETHGNGVGRPEYRLPMLIPGAILVPIGMIWYGWSVQKRLFWVMPDIGAVIFAIGVKIGTQCTQSYALDVYPTYSASASAASSFLRSIAGFCFPLFAPYLYQKLDYGWGNTLLAGVGLVIGVPAPIFFWYVGPSLRAKSQFAAGD